MYSISNDNSSLLLSSSSENSNIPSSKIDSNLPSSNQYEEEKKSIILKELEKAFSNFRLEQDVPMQSDEEEARTESKGIEDPQGLDSSDTPNDNSSNQPNQEGNPVIPQLNINELELKSPEDPVVTNEEIKSLITVVDKALKKDKQDNPYPLGLTGKLINMWNQQDALEEEEDEEVPVPVRNDFATNLWNTAVTVLKAVLDIDDADELGKERPASDEIDSLFPKDDKKIFNNLSATSSVSAPKFNPQYIVEKKDNENLTDLELEEDEEYEEDDESDKSYFSSDSESTIRPTKVNDSKPEEVVEPQLQPIDQNPRPLKRRRMDEDGRSV